MLSEDELFGVVKDLLNENVAPMSGGIWASELATKIARAIYEKMQKGVAWERPCNVAHLNRVLGFDVIGTELTDASGDTVYAVILGEWLGEDGQRGCITVTLE